VQTVQPQPIIGTPTLVPVPRNTNCPRMSVVRSVMDNLRSLCMPLALMRPPEFDES
jgi:hypothetical protein